MNHSQRLWTLTAGLFAVLSGTLYADTSVGMDVQGGKGTSGVDIFGTYDIKQPDFDKPFEASITYSHQHSTVETESRSNMISVGLAHELDDSLETHGTVNYWKDSINDIHYAGPSFGFTYTWLEGPSPSQPKTRDRYTEAPADDAGSDEIAALTFDMDLFFYSAEVTSSSSSVKVGRRNIELPPVGTTESLTQVHPNVTVEKPIFNQQVVPYLTLGHYFYSSDPSTLENISGRPRIPVSAVSMGSLVGGFLNNNAEFGVHWALPLDLDATTRIGADQTQTDNKWATIQGVELSRSFFKQYKADVEWERSIQQGSAADLVIAGLTYSFD